MRREAPVFFSHHAHRPATLATAGSLPADDAGLLIRADHALSHGAGHAPPHPRPPGRLGAAVRRSGAAVRRRAMTDGPVDLPGARQT